MELWDEQRQVVAPLFPSGKSGSGLRGRPRRDNREVLEGIHRVLRTGARWKVGRFFAWLFQCRRVVTRGEYRLAPLRGFVHVACLLILRRHSCDPLQPLAPAIVQRHDA
jgi:transposase